MSTNKTSFDPSFKHQLLSPEQSRDLLGKAKLVQSVEERNHSLIVASTHPSQIKHTMTNSTPVWNQYATLDRTEQQVFTEVMTLMAQVNELTKQQQREEEALERTSQRITELNDGEGRKNKPLGVNAQKETQLTIRQDEIDAVRTETMQLQRQKDIISSAGLQSQLIQQAKKRQIELQRQLFETHERLSLLKERENLRAEVVQLEQGRRQEQLRKQQEARECIRERIEMQEYLAKQEKEKVQFVEALMDFKQAYMAVHHTHEHLAKLVAQKRTGIL